MKRELLLHSLKLLVVSVNRSAKNSWHLKSTKCSCIRRVLCCRAKSREARAEENALQNANIVIPAQIAKQKPLLMRKQKPKNKKISKGETDAIFAKMEQKQRFI
jgi:hypothetical protein